MRAGSGDRRIASNGLRALLLFGAVCIGVRASHADAPRKVRVEICEQGIPEKLEWPSETPAATERYDVDALALFHVPFKYIDTGIRADRANPYLLRASAAIELPAGKHRLLLRGRGACRLSVDGQIVLTTPFVPAISDGHTPIPTKYLELCPGFRLAPPGNRETWTSFVSPGKTHTVVLESIVGGKRGGGALRQELGETVAAISLAGSETFRLVAPDIAVDYTDAGWNAFEAAEREHFTRLESARRREAFDKHAPELAERRERARKWLASTPEPKAPPLPEGMPAHNAIDHFLAARIEDAFRSGDRAAGSVDFVKQVRPILEAKCFSCHQGAKTKGQLALDRRDAALKGGKSRKPAIVPGEPDTSQLLVRIRSADVDEKMPPQGEPLTAQEAAVVRQWIEQGARYEASGVKRRPLPDVADDLTFLRRVTLDTVGVVPTLAEIDAFLADARKDRRAHVIDRLLADPRWADHWVGYWQDVLAENPNILNPTLNNTGPFRWWLHEALLDNKPMDVFVTELVRMRGSHYYGGPAGFAMASQNDAPMAEKAVILGGAFLGVQMKCARCHDAPGHKSTQQDLFQIAAMLAEAPLAVPATSSVPKDKLHEQGRKPLITVSLKPGTKVAPEWSFGDLAPKRPAPVAASLRDQLAELLTAPENERFAQVMANRLWKRLMGRGIVEPVDDWEKGEPSHPELLRFLGREFVREGHDMKKLARLILNSHAYARAADPLLKEPDGLHLGHVPRRLSAEQIVDSLFAAAGRRMNTEEVSLDLDGARDIKNSISLGKPRRAWHLASTSNERDRPSLSLPRVQAVVDVLEAFGWRSTRQNPQTDRDTSPNVIQPAILSNGVVGVWLTRLSDDHEVTQLALEARSPDELVERLFLRTLTRRPTADERATFVEHLRPGFAERTLPAPPVQKTTGKQPIPKYVTWSNHLTPEASQIKLEREAAARRGDPPTPRLTTAWRERMEDVLWAVLNSPEMIFTR